MKRLTETDDRRNWGAQGTPMEINCMRARLSPRKPAKYYMEHSVN